jgi:1-acyl-sn-glycerol-3-phosphate acyltransferase
MTPPESVVPLSESPALPDDRHDEEIKMKANLLVGLTKFVSGVSVRWVGCEPDARQRVYFANHASALDALLIWACLPPPARRLTRPVAAREYWNRGRVRRYVADKILGAVLIEPKKPTVRDNPLTAMITALGDRHSLILFPEGDRQAEIDMAPFKSGLYHLAKWRPDVEFVPVLVENLNRIFPKGEILPLPLMGYVSFGRPVKCEGDEDKHAFLDRAQAAVKALQQT